MLSEIYTTMRTKLWKPKQSKEKDRSSTPLQPK